MFVRISCLEWLLEVIDKGRSNNNNIIETGLKTIEDILVILKLYKLRRH